MFKPKRNLFDLTHDVKLSMNMGELIPILALDCVPGDKFHLGAETLIKFAPMVAPVLQRMDTTIHYYFVPNRLLWPNWENFITNTKDPNTEQLPIPPSLYCGTDGAYYTRLHDYFGLPQLDPVRGNPPYLASALPFAAYQMIYNEYYRDQNLIPPVDFKLKDGSNPPAQLTQLRNRSWAHDYFTSSLPFAQKGDAVDLPLGEVSLRDDWDSTPGIKPQFTPPLGTPATGNVSQDMGGSLHVGADLNDYAYDPDGSLTVAPTTVNDLRIAVRVQEWLERAARGGTRYIESILTHFGVKSSDSRLDRPEYICGLKTPVVISEVLNTTGTTELPQGNMSGHGVSYSDNAAGSFFCEEHGYIIGIMSVLPVASYQQGIPRHFDRLTSPTEYYFPSFANLGEQEVKIKELFADVPLPDNTFGYVPRYAEYKYWPSRVCGAFKQELDFWHLGRKFATVPTLSKEFIECTPDQTTRIFAVEGELTDQHLYVQIVNRVKAIRPMPKYGTPNFG